MAHSPFINAALPQESTMDYRKMNTETLKQIEAEAKAALAKTGSETLYRTRLGVLGAVSAVLATR